MSEEREIDVEELRGELEQIKDAMGIEERYDGATTMWLLFGLAVPVAAALSQFVVLERLPQWYHTVVWLAVLGGGFAVYAALTDRENHPEWSQEGKPNLFVQFAIVYVAAIPLQSIAFEYTGEFDYVGETALAFAIIVVVLGVAYGILGASMRAYYVRKRDRYVFYVGAVWMVALGTVIPESPTLERWAFAVFGGIYFVYAIAAYAFLRRGGDET